MTVKIDFNGILDCVADLYMDRCDILHAYEANVHGELCRTWEPVPDPCGNGVLTDISCQFRHIVSESIVNGNRSIDSERATLDIPCVFDCLSTRNRIRYGGCQWKVTGVINDMNVAMRLTLELVTTS